MNLQQPPQLPKVSVVITTYNNAQYLHECILSAAAQDYPNKDIWVVNDCSTDNTESVIGNFLQLTYVPLVFTHRREEIEEKSIGHYNVNEVNLYYCKLRQNSGPSKGRNIAILNALQAGTHCIQVLDADDRMYPTKISELIKPILLSPDRIAITYGDYNIVNELGVVRYESKFPYDYQIFFSGNCIIHSGSLLNGLAIKPLLPQVYPEHQRVTEDYYAYRKILRSGQWLSVHVPKILTLVRSHSQDSTSSVSKQIWEECFRRTMMET